MRTLHRRFDRYGCCHVVHVRMFFGDTGVAKHTSRSSYVMRIFGKNSVHPCYLMTLHYHRRRGRK
ncbi:hypothetical protein M137_1958 [Bacteroides fragilis str. S36L12]|nr:hypothetical protein M137_1958 [Bacteroides fragilis str. S36L12]